MNTSKLVKNANPGELEKLAQLRRTRERLASTRLGAHERAMGEHLAVVTAQRLETKQLGDALQSARQAYDESLRGGDCRVDRLQSLSQYVSVRAEEFNNSLQILSLAEKAWEEACEEQRRLAKALKIASFKLDQADSLKAVERSARTKRRDLNNETELENIPKVGVLSASFTREKF